ncbi:hypothetical protein GXW82_21290 [Streptacidiphilus sp. 4-A2]|nr:hypothetical protein [Streptacidiphilus sp. 4-A2]
MIHARVIEQLSAEWIECGNAACRRAAATQVNQAVDAADPLTLAVVAVINATTSYTLTPIPPAPQRQPGGKGYNARCRQLNSQCGSPQGGGATAVSLMNSLMNVGAVVLTAADLAQLGLDPATDAATAADYDVIASEYADSSADDEAGASCATNSFAPATAVLMPDGKTEPISKIKTGDKVEAADPTTGKLKGARTVQATMVNYDHNLLDVTVLDAQGHTSTLHTTTEHRFWDDTLHTWIPAVQLTPGHALETSAGGHAYVESIHVTPGAAYRYNLTIQQLHTYYVLAGTTPILVHNSAAFPCDEVGPNGWPKPDMNNCEECAKQIQSKIGGDIYRVSDSEGAPGLGPSTNDPWVHGLSTMSSSRMAPFTTDSRGPGMSMDAYRSQWMYGEYLSFLPYVAEG